jgi:hypothetical protein
MSQNLQLYRVALLSTRRKKNGNIHCWGCGKEGIVMSEFSNEVCIKKWKAKQDRKSNTTVAGQQHMNIGQHEVFEFKDTNEIIES